MALIFQSHADVTGRQTYPFPHFFVKSVRCLVGQGDFVVLPAAHRGAVVYGTELTLVVGRGGKHIAEDEAMEHIWGYTVLNDVTARGRPDPSQKLFDTSAPVGPWLVPRDQVRDPQSLRLLFRLNGRTVQDGNTADMRFTIAQIVAEVSRWFTLEPGDLIATGDIGATEPLKPGDVMEAEVEGVGTLVNPVRAEE